MSMHTEWDTATACEISAASADEINADWSLGEVVTEPYALVLGGGGGGCLAVEGTRDELIAFAGRVLAAVNTLPVELADVDPATRDPHAYPAGYDAVTDAHGN